jgi:hypothetical protein
VNLPIRARGAALLLPVLFLVAACSGGSSGGAPASGSSAPAASSASSPASSSASGSASATGSASGSAGAPSAGLTATTTALGPARVGQPLAAFAAALGRRPAAAAPGEGDTGCWVRALVGLPGVTLMTLDSADGAVRRVDVHDTSSIRTAAGVGVGSTEDQVKAAYPGARVEPHKYVDGAHYLTVADGAHGLVFETDAKKVVTTYRFGESDPISWVESCS